MYKIKEFIEGTVLILLLTIISMMFTKHPYMVLFIAGALLCLNCDRSFSEGKISWHFFAQVILLAGFVVATDIYLVYIIFLFIGNKWIFLPSLICIICQLVVHRATVPETVWQSLVLLVLSSIIYVISHLIDKYLTARKKVLRAVNIMAVNEMYAKKLNEELVIKNYLADKNARLEEREDISRNIHNSVGHSITAAIMTLDAADMLFPTSPDKAREKMNIANNRIRSSLDSIRQAVRVLDNDNRSVDIKDFIDELIAVTDSFVMDTMIKIHTDFKNVSDATVIPREHTEFLTGALKEFLSNGVRHGNADTFMIALIADSQNLMLKVIDNGKSDFSIENQQEYIEQGYGLKKIDSYVKKCGGRTMYCNESGFRAEISIKLKQEEKNE